MCGTLVNSFYVPHCYVSFSGDFGIFGACLCLRIDFLSSLGGRGNSVFCVGCVCKGLRGTRVFQRQLIVSLKYFTTPVRSFAEQAPPTLSPVVT